jgi:hypothetical protein
MFWERFCKNELTLEEIQHMHDKRCWEFVVEDGRVTAVVITRGGREHIITT